MKCPKCGYDLPEDSEYCQYCGNKLPLQSVSNNYNDVNQNITMPISGQNLNAVSFLPIESKSDDQKVCRNCGEIMSKEAKKCPLCGKKVYHLSSKWVRITAFVLMLSLLLGLSVFQNVRYKNAVEENALKVSDLNGQIEPKDAAISELQVELDGYDSTIAEQKKVISDQANRTLLLEDKANYYDDISDFLFSGNPGYSSSNFFADEFVFIIDDGISRYFELTADFYSSATIYHKTEGQSARIEFLDSSWYGSTTTIRVIPIREGSTTITFSNSVNSESFKILIIVTNS